MSQQQRNVQVRVDTYTRVCLTVIAVLLTVLILGLWAERTPLPERAVAKSAKSGIPDAGAQRVAMVKAVKENTDKVEELIRLFETGQAKVQVMAEEEKAGRRNVPTRKAE
jgi:hypothetical protein